MADAEKIQFTLADGALINAIAAWCGPHVSTDELDMLEAVIGETVNQANHHNPRMARLIEQARAVAAIGNMPAPNRAAARATQHFYTRTVLHQVFLWRLGEVRETLANRSVQA